MAYFKLDMKSKTGLVIQAIFDKTDEVERNRICFMKRVGAEKGLLSGALIAGAGSVFFDGTEEHFERVEWKIGDKQQSTWIPKVKSKYRKEYDSIGSVERCEIDKAIGNQNWMISRCGYAMSKDKKHLLFDVTMKPKMVLAPIELTDDLVEILTSEYEELSK